MLGLSKGRNALRRGYFSCFSQNEVIPLRLDRGVWEDIFISGVFRRVKANEYLSFFKRKHSLFAGFIVRVRVGKVAVYPIFEGIRWKWGEVRLVALYLQFEQKLGSFLPQWQSTEQYFDG